MQIVRADQHRNKLRELPQRRHQLFRVRVGHRDPERYPVFAQPAQHRRVHPGSERQTRNARVVQPHVAHAPLPVQSPHLLHRISRGHDRPLRIEAAILAQPLLKETVSVNRAHLFRVGMVDQRPLHPVAVHLSQQLLPVPARRRLVMQVAHAHVGVKNGNARAKRELGSHIRSLYLLSRTVVVGHLLDRRAEIGRVLIAIGRVHRHHDRRLQELIGAGQ